MNTLRVYFGNLVLFSRVGWTHGSQVPSLNAGDQEEATQSSSSPRYTDAHRNLDTISLQDLSGELVY